MNIGPAERLTQLPPYLFAEIDRKKRAAIAAGRDIIDFGVGDPDMPTPDFIVDRMSQAIRDPANHPYAHGLGILEYREAVARFMDRRYGVTVNPVDEVLALLGSKEGIGHMAIAIVNPGDVVLVPEPGYPVYASGTIFAGGRCHTMPLREENGWLPHFDEIPEDVRRQARVMWINYPNNPTSAVATLSFFEEVIAFARKYDIFVAHDTAYSELYYGDKPPSIMQINGARELAVEFHSLSKTFNMTGWRLAFVVGHRDVLAALSKVKNNLDSGAFQAVQHAGIAALDGIDRSEIRGLIDVYRRRRAMLVGGLREAGWPVTPPDATFYLWAKCPVTDSMMVTSRLLDETAVVVIPGAGFGPTGEGFVRFSLTVPDDRISEAVQRISSLRW